MIIKGHTIKSFADLRSANLEGADLSYANLSNANLFGMIMPNGDVISPE